MHGPHEVCRLCVYGVCDRLGEMGGNQFNQPQRLTDGVYGFSEYGYLNMARDSV